jgi:sec-independent protein translocase protein TatA
MFGLGIGEGLIILAIVLLMFGGKKLPQLAKSLGQSMNAFKKGLNESEEKKDKIENEDKTQKS